MNKSFLIYREVRENTSNKKPYFILMHSSALPSDPDITIELPCEYSGKLVINDRLFELKNGQCTVAKERLIGKVIYPRLLSGGKIYLLSPFSISEGHIDNIALKSMSTEFILSLILSQDQELKALKEEILKLKNLIRGQELFTFS